MEEELRKPLLTMKDFISGAAAGVTQILIGQPFDMVKVRMQTSRVKTSPVQIIKDIYSKEGPMAFYKGTLPPLVGQAFAIAVQFCGFEITKRYLKKQNQSDKLSNAQILLCGVSAGICDSVVINIIELPRIKMQLQQEGSTRYTSSIDATIKIFKESGIRGFAQGYSATLAREVIGNAGYFGAYEYTMQTATIKLYDGDRSKVTTGIILFAGAMAGIFMWTTAFPIDVMKTEMQGCERGDERYSSFVRTFKHIYRTSGGRGFFNGIVPCIARAPPVNACSFLVYEKVQSFLNSRSSNKV